MTESAPSPRPQEAGIRETTENALTAPRGFLARLGAIPSGFWHVFRAETSLMKTHPRFGLAVAAICFFPALYLLIYLGGVWDPVARTGDLPVAIVNLDRGIDYRGHRVNVGEDLAAKLLARDDFGFETVTDESAARRAVANGETAFAVVVPADFSANAVPGAAPGKGRIRIVLSEGNNYTTSGIARRFASEISHEINETLNASRWEAVLATAGESAGDLKQLKSGVGELRAGAARLNEGTSTFQKAADDLADGVSQLAGGIRTMDAHLPAAGDLDALKRGTVALAGGQRNLGNGLARLRSGAGQLEAGLAEMQEKSKSIPFAGQKVGDGAAQLKAGAQKLKNGISSARAGSNKLASGADEVAKGTARLADGMSALGDGIHQMAEKLPSDSQLADFKSGADQLSDGSAKLLVGLEKLDAAIPADIETIGGSAEGLANSVTPVLDNLAPVENNGAAFAPSMLSVASWVGAVIIANMFSLRAIRQDLAGAPRLAKTFGKLTLPALIVVAQSLLLAVAMRYGLMIAPVDPAGFWAVDIVASLTFITFVFALLRVVGDAGKLVAVLLLTLQLTAGGGILPAELTGSFYQSVHEWLPFTYAIQGFRAAIFGAFGGDWQTPLKVLSAFLGGSLVVAILVGRWRIVDAAHFKPSLDL